MASEPFHNDLAHCNTCNFTAYTIDGKAEASPDDLHGVAEHFAFKVMANGVPLDECTGKHEEGGENTRKTDAEFVEDDTTEKQQEKEGKERLHRKIMRIDEPVIRTLLLDKYREAYPETTQSERIAELKKELAELTNGNQNVEA